MSLAAACIHANDEIYERYAVLTSIPISTVYRKRAAASARR